MDPNTLFVQGVLPAILISFLTLVGLLQRRTLPVIFTGIAYLAGYVVLIGIPAFAAKTPRTPEAWEAMLPAAIFATIAAVLIELLPLRWPLRLPAFALAAAISAWLILPTPVKLDGDYGTYFLLTFAASLAILLALRLPDARYPAPLPPLVLCLTAFGTGFLIAWFLHNGKQGQPGLILSVPLGAIATFTLFRPVREIARAAVTPAALILPGLVALAYFYHDPPTLIPMRLPWIFGLLAFASLAPLVALLPPIRKKPWLAVVTPVALTLGLVGGALAIAVASAVPSEY